MNLLKEIKQIAEGYELSISFRQENNSDWSVVLAELAYIPVLYTHSSIEFQWAYQRGHGGVWQDISMTIFQNNKPIAIWPLSLSLSDEKYSLTSLGLNICPPIYTKDFPVLSQKKLTKKCVDFLENIAKLKNVTTWTSMESFLDKMDLSFWHQESMSRGSTCSVSHELFIDLGLSLDEIKKRFRKSYKSLVNSGEKYWDIKVLDTEDKEIWNQFKNLHIQVAGRKTRSDETWDIHLEDINQKKGFLIYLLNKDGLMDGAGFFNYTRDEGLYAVAAYNRELFDKPLGHVVQFQAIQEMKKRSVRWYKLGLRPYDTDTLKPTEKELSIGDFKQGFSSHMYPRYDLIHSNLMLSADN